MNFNYKNRIALNFLIASAVTISLVFLVIYAVVLTTVYQNLDRAVSYEAIKHSHGLTFTRDSIHFLNRAELEEREHREADVIPVFIQIIDADGNLMDKSPNLKEQALKFNPEDPDGDHFNTMLNGKAIRQLQLPLIFEGQTRGYVLAAMSLEDSKMVIGKLRNILLALFPLVLLSLFFITRLLAGKSIAPVARITATADRITRNNLNERIELPKTKDELYTLASSINELLERIGNAIERERQFTSDASHELRTPLSVIKGTMEVLIRKPRTEAEYREKIAYALTEIDRMSNTIDQLLMLARFDKTPDRLNRQSIQLVPLLDDILQRYEPEIIRKNLQINIDDNGEAEVESDPYYIDLILDNVISNAIKYSFDDSSIQIRVFKKEGETFCEITDHGVGIRQEDIPSVFTPFFRSDALKHKRIPGNGLGLSIVKKACTFINADFTLTSLPSQGTTATLKF